MKKITKMISALSAAVMFAVCAVPTYAETEADRLQVRNEELASQYPAPVEIDRADPNYPILAVLEKSRNSGGDSFRVAEYKLNDENGNAVKHWKYIPDEGVTVRSQYTNRNKQYDMLTWYKPASIIVNPYKACSYLQVTTKDLINESPCETMFVIGRYMAEGLQLAYMNSQYELITDVTKYQQDGYNDIFNVNYYLNDDGSAVIVNIEGGGLNHTSDKLLKEDWIVPTEIPTETGNIPVAEILPGAYAYLSRAASETTTQVVFTDPFSDTTPQYLVYEVKFGDGDITEDGEFSVSDAVYGARMIAEDKTLQVSDAGRAAADMDANGKVNVADLTLMLDLLATYNGEVPAE